MTNGASRRNILLGLSGCAISAGCSKMPSYTVGFAASIKLIFKQRQFSARSVWLSRWTQSRFEGVDAVGRWEQKIAAESPVFDLEDGSYAFALLAPPRGYEAGYRIFPVLDLFYPVLLPYRETRQAAFRSGAIFEMMRAFEGEIQLPEDKVPWVVTFSNLADKTSVKPLYEPGASSPGQAARVVSASLRVTSEPLTHHLLGYLPWASSGGNLVPVDGKTDFRTASFPQRLNPSHFLLQEPKDAFER